MILVWVWNLPSFGRSLFPPAQNVGTSTRKPDFVERELNRQVLSVRRGEGDNRAVISKREWITERMGLALDSSVWSCRGNHGTVNASGDPGGQGSSVCADFAVRAAPILVKINCERQPRHCLKCQNSFFEGQTFSERPYGFSGAVRFHLKHSFLLRFPNSFYQKHYRYNFSTQISLGYKNRLFFFHKIIHRINFQWYIHLLR